MKISVAIPAFNAEQFIEKTLDSVLSQNRPPDEVVVVDDGSTDGTPAILEKYGAPIRHIRIENRGCGAARKESVDQCRNEWIALCDSDDLWCKDHLSRAAEMLEVFPDANILASNFSSFGGDSTERPERLASAPAGWLDTYTETRANGFRTLRDPFIAQLEFNPIYPSGLIFHLGIYREVGEINPDFSRWQAEDTELTRRMLASPRARLVLDDKVTWQYRRHVGNMSSIYWKNAYGRAKILEYHLAEGIVPVDKRPYVERKISESLAHSFDAAFWGGFYRDARNLYRELPRGQRNIKRRTRKVIAGIKSISA